MALHILQRRLGLAVIRHKLNRLAVRGQAEGRQEHPGKLRPGDGLLRPEGPVRVAADPARLKGRLDFLFGPVVQVIRCFRCLSRHREAQHHHAEQQDAQPFSHPFHILSRVFTRYMYISTETCA